MPQFKTIHEVNREFYAEFIGRSVVKTHDSKELPFIECVDYNNESFDTLFRYFNRSGESSVEEIEEYYPVITVQNFTPKIDKNRLVKVLRGYEGDFDLVNGTGSFINFPIPFIHKYQVSVATRTEPHSDCLQQWFYSNFDFEHPEPCFLMNKVPTKLTIDEGDLGTVVIYSAEVIDIEREDGIFEFAVDYNLKTFIHAKVSTNGFDRVSDINIDLIAKGL